MLGKTLFPAIDHDEDGVIERQRRVLNEVRSENIAALHRKLLKEPHAERLPRRDRIGPRGSGLAATGAADAGRVVSVRFF
ncbi:hypothetical protein GCM10020258_51470 [Sphingomonas yabuuchiae]